MTDSPTTNPWLSVVECPPATGPTPERPQEAITQEELQLFDELDAEFKSKKEQRESLRVSILDRLERGASVEGGPLSAECVIRLNKQLSKAKLVQLFGQERTDELLRMIEPTRFRHLHVRPRAPQRNDILHDEID